MQPHGPWLSLRDFMANRPACLLSIADIGDPSLRTLVEQYSEGRCAFLPVPENRVLCRVLGKYLMWVDAHDRGLGPHLIFQGYWEMWITAAIARCARAGSTAVDVGANVGYYTLLLADAVGAGGRVLSFEPNPRLSEMLGMSSSINGFAARVSVKSEALGLASGPPLPLGIPRYEPKNAAIVHIEADRESLRANFGDDIDFVDVPIRAMDDHGLVNLSVVKIDVEGAEYDIWQGMQRTIDRNPEICILMEINASRRYDVFKFLEEISRRFSIRHVDFDGAIKPLTSSMLTSERVGEDWMLYLCRA